LADDTRCGFDANLRSRGFFISWAQGTPIVRVFGLVAAAVVWLIGRAVRALLR